MKVGDIIQRIQSLYSKGVESDDSRLTNRHIYNKLLTVRSKLIKQDLEKKKKFNSWDKQLLRCVELEKVPAYNCPCVLPPSCKTVLRSKYKIPEPIGGKIFSITTVDKSKKIDLLEKNAVNSLLGNKYTSKKMVGFFEDEYLYIINGGDLAVVTLEAVFEDPLEIEKFNERCEGCKDCLECPSDPREKDFPIDADKIDTLIELSVIELVEFFRSNKEDISNNSRDSLVQESK